MKKLLSILLMVPTLAFSQAIASRRYAELTPEQYHFGPFSPVAYNNPFPYTTVPDSQIQPSSVVLDNNAFASTGDFTVIQQQSPAATFTVASNIGTITTGSGSNQNYVIASSASSFSIPDMMVSVEINANGVSSGTDHIAVGIGSSTVQIVTECDMVGHTCFITVFSGGSFFNFGGTTFTAPSAPWYLGLSLCGSYATMWYRTTGGWTMISSPQDVSSHYDPRATGNLSGLQTILKLFTSQSTTWQLSNLKTTLFGGVGIRDTHLITYADGRPYMVGSTCYLLATIAGAINNDQASANGIFSYDLNSKTLTLRGSIGVTRSGVFEDQSGVIIYSPATNSERLVISSWGNTNSAPVVYYASQTISTDDWLSPTTHVHVTPSATQMTLPNATTPYDPYLTCTNWNYSSLTCSKWIISYTQNNALAATSTSDPSANSWTADFTSSQSAIEGTLNLRTATGASGVVYTVAAAGTIKNEVRQGWLYGATGTLLGNVSAPLPAGADNPPHEQYVSYGNTEYLITFNNATFDYITQTMGAMEVATASKYSAQTNWPTQVNAGSIFSGGTSVTSESLSTGDYASTFTLSAGQLVTVMVRGGNASVGSVTVTDGLSNTYTCGSIDVLTPSGASGFDYACYSFIANGGTATFTATLGAASQFVGVTALQFTPGFLTGADGNITYSNIVTGSQTSQYATSPFSTTAKGLIVVCPDALFGGKTFQPGFVGPYVASFGAGLTTGAAPCEGSLTEGAQSGITATMASDGSVGWWGGVVMSFK